MRASIRTAVGLLALLVACASIQTQTLQAQSPAPVALTSPEKFFGFQMGADRKLANWDKLHEYYQLLAKSSNRVKLVELGKSISSSRSTPSSRTRAGCPRLKRRS